MLRDLANVYHVEKDNAKRGKKDENGKILFRACFGFIFWQIWGLYFASFGLLPILIKA